MFRLTPNDLVRIWETGQRQTPLERCLTILSIACSDRTFDQWLDLGLGQRDRLLLHLRQWLFGPHLNGFINCPNCDEQMEFKLGIPQVCQSESSAFTSSEQVFSTDGFELRFRLPRNRDLLSISSDSNPDQVSRLLVRSCLETACCNGNDVRLDDLPDAVVKRLAARVVECDPLQEILLDMTCPACNQRWQPVLDIGQFLWEEVAAYARRLLREVHTLARAYGWREEEVLALSAGRRQAYLELVGS
jgi:hypothetical protein